MHGDLGYRGNQRGRERATDVLFDTRVTIVRLRATAHELKSRFMGRGGHEEQADEAVRWAEKMDRDLVRDLCVDTDGLTPIETATLVRVAAGDWPGLT